MIWTHVPDGKAMGCLPRRYRPGEVCPMAAERIGVIPRSEWGDYATDLQPRVDTILDQDGVGSCAAESTTQALMVARDFAGLPHVPLNPWGLYHYTSHGRDGGSSIDENLEIAREKGIPSMAVWPREKGWRASLSEEAVADAMKYRIEEFFDIQSVDEFVSALLKGYPVVFGANGHAVCAVRHAGDAPWIANSWATSWGARGFGIWCRYAGINWGYGAFAVRTAQQTEQ